VIVFKEIPLRAFMGEVSASFNAQAKHPDRQWAPCIFQEILGSIPAGGII